MTDTKHAATPWEASAGFSPDIMTVITSADGDVDYLTLGNHKANAAFIVKAVNSHDNLVEILEAVANYLAEFSDVDDGGEGNVENKLLVNIEETLKMATKS